jgi:uncharacterized membrane protein
MLQETHDKMRPVFASRDHGFHWRGREISRIEGLSDAVFAFAITLLVVSLEVPKTFAELREMMHGFVAFGICFLLLLLIWHAQYIYFRRYALDDRTSFVLNAALLFVVAFYIYPLKFLFSTLVNQFTGYQPTEGGVAVAMVWMTRAEWRQLMLIYGAGFIGLYVIFALLYLHAYRLRGALELTALEAYETMGIIRQNMLMIGIGLLSIVLAWFGRPALSGMIYMLIAPASMSLGMWHGRRRKRFATAPAALMGSV